MISAELVKYPLLFQDNRITRFYLGGKLMNAWRKLPPIEDSHQCEELLVTSIGAISKGEPEGYAISKTIEAQGAYLLSELIQAYPNEILGSRFQAYHKNQLSVLARVGDTRVRLVMQCHPTREDAMRYFHMPMGKTEAWYIARTHEDLDACVYAGFKEGVSKQRWTTLFKQQDIEGMLSCLHRLPVQRGDTILIPAGMPHCVGPGCLFLEYHECNDITIRVEKKINGMEISEEEMFYGLSSEDGLNLFDYHTYSQMEILEAVKMKEIVLEETKEYQVLSLIDETKNDSFGMQLIKLQGSYELPAYDGHRILVAVEQDVTLEVEDHNYLLLQGHAALIPAACKHLKLAGTNAKVTVGIPYIARKEETK